MQKLFFYLLFFFLPFNHFGLGGDRSVTAEAEVKFSTSDLYAEMQLDSIVDYSVFEKAMAGYSVLNIPKKDVITLIDFSKPSTQERLFVLDLKNKKMLYSSLVAHGKRSGENYATSFSNKNGSHKSSLGFYITENTYRGRSGYSLILNGLERGINDQAKYRSIVIHGADYANPSVISESGRLGRSFGCPALPENINEPIINAIKGGTMLFIYANDSYYMKRSPVLTSAKNKRTLA